MKFLISGLLLICLAVSCRKVDDNPVFEKTADQRITEILAAYQSQLSGEPNGWKGQVYTKSGGIFTFYFKFNDSNRVKMLSSFDSTSAVTLKESSYRIKALQQPSLIFDTYSYIHELADPNPSVNGGAVGQGLSSDFEFYFNDRETTKDTVSLVGRFNGSKAILVRATAQEAAAFTSGQLASALQLAKIVNYYKRIIINGKDSADININTKRSLVSQPDAQGNLMDTSLQTGYYLTLGGLTFVKPIKVGTLNVTQISGIVYNSATSTITATINGSPAVIKGVVTPIKVDLTAPKRWYDFAVNSGNTYWLSIDGFHVNGVDDAFNIKAIVSGANTYYFLIYWPKYAPNNDFFGPIFLNAAQTGLTLIYGTAPRLPNFTPDGRAIFSQLGNYGTYPTTGAAAQSRTLLYNSSGYYFVQKNATEYDMVSAADGKAWITWEF